MAGIARPVLYAQVGRWELLRGGWALACNPPLRR